MSQGWGPGSGWGVSKCVKRVTYENSDYVEDNSMYERNIQAPNASHPFSRYHGEVPKERPECTPQSRVCGWGQSPGPAPTRPLPALPKAALPKDSKFVYRADPAAVGNADGKAIVDMGKAMADFGDNEWGDNAGDARGSAVASSAVLRDDGGFGGETGGGQGGNGGGCFNCGQEGHMKSECPEPPKGRTGACFNCGEEGHNKADCTNPTNPDLVREFTGTCRICEQAGHRAADCPDAPAKICSNCKEEGHVAFGCTKPRKLDRADVETVAAETAWAELVAAVKERDLDDVIPAIHKYVKALPATTFAELEQGLRHQDIPLYIIAIEKELGPTWTNMDFQGNLDREFTVQFRFSKLPGRPIERAVWPASDAENFERLANAGMAVDRGVEKCTNCDELGHRAKQCPQEKIERTDKVEISCNNCNELGHRQRDCPQPRLKGACRNCKQQGHSSKECPEPRSAEGVECKKCNEMGHFAKDCPQGGGGGFACRNCGEEGHKAQDCEKPRVIKCRNCDEEGHVSRECPKPRDYSRVKCSNCDQMGHTKVRCKEPIKEDPEAEGGAGGAGGDGGFGGDDVAITGNEFADFDGATGAAGDAGDW